MLTLLLIGHAHGAHCSEKAQSIDLKKWSDPATAMEFVRVPEGCFTMGSSPDEEGRGPDDIPQHQECIGSIWVGVSEVTVAQFRIFVENTGYRTDAEREGFSWIYTGEWVKRGGYNWREPGFEQESDHPVVHVSWNDAQAMAKWLSKQGNGTFRLPDEAEWEYACRAGSQAVRYWGDDADGSCAYANAADVSSRKEFPAWVVTDCRDGHIYTAPVRSFQPNGFGLYDMLGNVWEWSDSSNDRGRTSERGWNLRPRAGSREGKAIRGGSWYSRPAFLRCASREGLDSPERRSYDLGFRLVRIAE